MTTTTYEAKHIKKLEGLEAIRRLPGMYIGNNSVYGLHHLLMELIDNAVDEILNGYGDTITVNIHPDGSASVADNGRGIPVEYKPDTKVSALTQVRLHPEPPLADYLQAMALANREAESRWPSTPCWQFHSGVTCSRSSS